ncbi:XXYS1_4_G0044980.mRNA.1.CDS.1 [Saccharomyces cerevisiae]|nr:XXYS1_4_G0044980.mRNA.1.CDS.1 [Saccharomyces cerevisiae]
MSLNLFVSVFSAFSLFRSFLATAPALYIKSLPNNKVAETSANVDHFATVSLCTSNEKLALVAPHESLERLSNIIAHLFESFSAALLLKGCVLSKMLLLLFTLYA